MMRARDGEASSGAADIAKNQLAAVCSCSIAAETGNIGDLEGLVMNSTIKGGVKIAPNNPVFDLPVIVGIEENLFAKAGPDVSFSATYADREKDSVQTPLMSRLKENLFDGGSADSYNVCEWASIDR